MLTIKRLVHASLILSLQQTFRSNRAKDCELYEGFSFRTTFLGYLLVDFLCPLCSYISSSSSEVKFGHCCRTLIRLIGFKFRFPFPTIQPILSVPCGFSLFIIHGFCLFISIDHCRIKVQENFCMDLYCGSSSLSCACVQDKMVGEASKFIRSCTFLLNLCQCGCFYNVAGSTSRFYV